MKGRMLASVVMTAIGASLLAVAMFASTASGAGAGSATATAKKGGSLTQVSRSDFDYVDPGLAYFSHSWEMMGATNLTLLYYPHTEGPGPQPPRRHGVADAAGVERRQDVRLHRQEGLPLLRREAGDGRELQAGVRSREEPDDAVARVVVHGRHRELFRQGPGLHGHDEEGRAGLPRPDDDAVLLRGARRPAVHGRGRQGTGHLGRPVLPQGVEREELRPRGAEPVLEEQPGAVQVARLRGQPRPDPLDRRARPRDAAADVRARRGRPLRRSRRHRRRSWPTSTASTRASSSSSRRSATGTSR